MIEAQSLTKRYGGQTVVDNLSFRAEPGSVTGFLGPNGAGKSTTMRMILGLDRPSSGRVTVNGRDYVDSRAPLCEIGALLDAKAAHPNRSARNHLVALAATHGLPRTRVDEVLERVGLTSVSGKHPGKFSLGMSQRLGIAVALLGDPKVVILDEPVNGLDPEGVRWIRSLLRGLADEGRTILVSSHLMSEMSQTADHLVVIGRGRLLTDTTVTEFVRRSSAGVVRVRSSAPGRLKSRLRERGVRVVLADDGALEAHDTDGPTIGDAALSAGVAIHELTPVVQSLEDAFMELTEDSIEYHASAEPEGVSA